MLLDNILNNLRDKNNIKAYTINDKTYMYSDLYKFVCNIYNFLLKKDIQNKTVIVYGGKDVYMKASFLACSFAGITYIPVDRSIPYERIIEIIKQANPGLIIGDLKCDSCEVINEKKIYQIMEKDNYIDIEKIYLKENDIYYIIFTSGSTGTPKGVKVTYKNLDSCIEWLKSITNIENGTVLNQANFSFDLSVADLYLSLLTKSEHYIIDDEVKGNYNLLFSELKNSKASLAIFTPSFADLLLLDKSFNEELMPNLKTIIFCGERLLNSTVEKLYSIFKNLRIINTYGPTECTFAVTNIEVPRNQQYNKEIPIGMPKKDVNIYVVDENKKELEDEKVGEILITGKSVAAGYVGKNENESFIEYNGNKAYLTGDLGYKKDGILYYKARKDRQIKYKGYRIELSDIENNLNRLEYIDRAIVATKESDDKKILKIIGFVKLKSDTNKEAIQIKKDLIKRIPEYMCPTIKIIDKIPINKNGKCDINKLLEDY